MVALLVIVSLAYVWRTSTGGMTSEPITFFTTTTTNPLGVMQCTLARYIVYNVAYTQNSTTSLGYSTETDVLQTYLTTTTQTMPIGFTTAFTTSYSTYTGVHALANITSCEYISG